MFDRLEVKAAPRSMSKLRSDAWQIISTIRNLRSVVLVKKKKKAKHSFKFWHQKAAAETLTPYQKNGPKRNILFWLSFKENWSVQNALLNHHLKQGDEYLSRMWWKRDFLLARCSDSIVGVKKSCPAGRGQLQSLLCLTPSPSSEVYCSISLH